MKLKQDESWYKYLLKRCILKSGQVRESGNGDTVLQKKEVKPHIFLGV